jgi:hypothetical protein
MRKVFEQIDEALAAWMTAQPLWFVATAHLRENGRVCLDGDPLYAQVVSAHLPRPGRAR